MKLPIAKSIIAVALGLTSFEAGAQSIVVANPLEWAALAEGNEEMSRAHGRAARAFVEEHILAWLPRFFDEVARRSKGSDMDALARSYYQGLSAYAREVLLLLEKEE